MLDNFDNATYLSQVRKLRSLGIEAIKQYPIGKYELKFINHGENTTFKVITKKKNYLLRIHCRSFRSKAAFLEELKWLDSLSRKTNILVQKPLRSRSGELIINLKNDRVGHSRYCDVLEWQDGYIKNKKTPSTFYEVGKLIGQLQKYTIKSKHRNYWDANGLIGKHATLGALSQLRGEYPRYTKKIEALRSYLHKKLKQYEKKNSKRLSLIHADLHFGNMIWNKGDVRPIDFDDCGYGLEMYDLAVTLAQSSHFFKKIGQKQAHLNKHAFLEGYQKYKELTDEDVKILPYLVAVRELAMLGWLYERSDNPELANYLKGNIGIRIQKAEKYIKQADQQKYF